MNGNKFAVSTSIFGPGLIVLADDGTFYYLDDASKVDETIEARKSNGFEEVDFEGLVKELIESKIEPRGPELPEELKTSDDSNWEEFQNLCKDIGNSVYKHVASNGEESFKIRGNDVDSKADCKKQNHKFIFSDLNGIKFSGFFTDEFFQKAKSDKFEWTDVSIDRQLYQENLWLTFIKSAGLFLTAYLLSWVFGADEGIVFSVLILPLIAILKTAYLDFEPLFIQAAYCDKSIIVRRGTAAESIERFDLRTVENIELKLTPIGKLRNSGTLDIYGYGGQIRIPYVKDPLALQAELERLIQTYKSDHNKQQHQVKETMDCEKVQV